MVPRRGAGREEGGEAEDWRPLRVWARRGGGPVVSLPRLRACSHPRGLQCSGCSTRRYARVRILAVVHLAMCLVPAVLQSGAESEKTWSFQASIAVYYCAHGVGFVSVGDCAKIQPGKREHHLCMHNPQTYAHARTHAHTQPRYR